MLSDRRTRLFTMASLAVLYTVWGSTYLAQRVAVSSFPPLQMAGLRFTIAGAVLFAAMRIRGAPAPRAKEWRGVALSALPLLVTGMGTAALALRRVPSALAALVFGSVPLWASLFDWLWGGRLRRAEWVGLALGFAGVGLVSLGGGLRADPGGALLLLGAAASYALGCVCTRRLALPKGILGTAAQMLVGGAALLLVSFARGERLATPAPKALFALVYLVVLGSLVAYVAFGYLLRNTRPALATSYAFVNPIVALALGTTLAGEHFSRADLVGLAFVLAAVGLVALGAGVGERPSPALGAPAETGP